MWSDCHSATEDIFAKRLRNKSGTYNVAGLAVCFLFHSIERLPSELVVADDAGKTIHVEDLIHGSASCTFPNYVFSTPSTAAKVFVSRWIFHVIQHLFGQVLKLILWAERRGN